MFVSKYRSHRFARGLFLVLAASLGLAGCEYFDVNKVTPSIYRIIVFKELKDKDGKVHQETSFGTGFLASGVNIVVTNYHVVKDAEKDRDGKPMIFIGYLKSASKSADSEGTLEPMWAQAKIEEFRDAKDIAILKAEQALPGEPLRLADFGDVTPEDGNVKAIGFPVAADFQLEGVTTESEMIDRYIKNPALLKPTRTDGPISKTLMLNGVPHIQHQASVSGGNSGGPLFDECGVVIGVNSKAATQVEYIGLAIYAKEVVDILRLANLQHNVHSQRCNAPDFQRKMPIVVAGAGILLALMSMVFALRRPAFRDRMTRMILPSGSTNMRGTDARRPPPSEMGAHPTMVATERGSRVASKGSLRLIPTGGGSPITIGIEQLSGEGAVLGRQRDCGIVVENETVSKRHARLRINSSGKLSVEDLNSGNGTWRGKERIKSAVAEEGETVRFGSMSFRVALSNAGVSDVKSAGAGTVVTNAKTGRSEHCWILSGFDESGKVVQFTLEARLDPASGKETETSWTIGRKPDRVDHVLIDQSVSSEHARIRYSAARGLEISDLGSSNGTKIDGTPVSSSFVPLEGARRIEFGRFKMTLSRA